MKINLQILDLSTNKYSFKKSINIPFIPRKDEKFVYQDNESNNDVYIVNDVFYSETNIEILLTKYGNVSDYHKRLGLHLF